MNVQRISNKASVFLNHKHFHPGNSKNREKVWLAEEKLKEEEKKQEELLKKRKKEWEIEELRRDIRKSHKKIKDETRTQPEIEGVTNNNNQLHYMLIDNNRADKSWIKSKLYEEDIFLGNHSSVWGSFYEPKTKKWGFKCCKSTKRSSVCSSYNKSKSQTLNSFDTCSVSDLYLTNNEDHSTIGTYNYNSYNNSNNININNNFLLLNTGKPFSKQQKGVSEFLNILKQSQSEKSN